MSRNVLRKLILCCDDLLYVFEIYNEFYDSWYYAHCFVWWYVHAFSSLITKCLEIYKMVKTFECHRVYLSMLLLSVGILNVI